MRFLTKEQSEEWLIERRRQLPDAIPAIEFTVGFPAEAYRYRFVAHFISTSLAGGDSALLLMTEWSIWPSSENWHLYYKVRQSYGDHRQLNEAPGHLFQDDELEDLASFLQMAMHNGWGGYVLTGANRVNLFFSHDEYIKFYASEDEELNDVREVFQANPQKAE